MLKEVFASNVAKLVAACVCPVVATSAIVVKVPQVRAAVHRATAPKVQPQRKAPVPPPARKPIEIASSAETVAPAMMCSSPIAFHDVPLQPVAAPAPIPTVQIEMRPERVAVPVACGPVGTASSIMTTAVGGVPEPATWAQMIAGFALLGGTLRIGRRRNAALA